jgi:hypothetical protein
MCLFVVRLSRKNSHKDNNGILALRFETDFSAFYKLNQYKVFIWKNEQNSNRFEMQRNYSLNVRNK